MDLVTAIAVMNQQCFQLNNLLQQLTVQSTAAEQLIGEENSIAAINPQIHSLTASMSIIMTAIGSQTVIVQNAIDKVAELSV